MKKLYTLFALFAISTVTQAQVVISQVYGGGGNTGATYSNDFIELFNRGTFAQDLTGWSVQYTSATGPNGASTPNWITTTLPSFILQPGQYFLIQQAAGTTAALSLPTPDLIGTTSNTLDSNGTGPVTGTGAIPMSGSNGKVILVNVVTQQTGNNPSGSQILDKVGYGLTPTGFEGTGPTGTALTSSTSVQRINGGCTDSNNNVTDYTTVAPTPRNSSTPINTCSLATSQNTIISLDIYPNPLSKGVLYINTKDNDTKSVSVFDVLGKLVLNTNISGNEISVNSLKSGVYILKVTENGKTATRKLIIR